MVYYSDPFVACWVKAISYLLGVFTINSQKYFYVPHLILVWILSFYLLPRVAYPSSETSKHKGSKFDTLLYSVSLVIGLFLLDQKGLVFLDILPLLMLLYSVFIFPVWMKKFSLYTSILILLSVLSFISFLFNAGPLSFLYILLISPLFFLSYSKYKNSVFIVVICISFLTSFYFSKDSVIFDYPRDAVLTPLSSLVHLSNVIIGQDRIPFPVNAYHYFESRTASLWLLLILITPGVVFGLYSYLERNFHNSSPSVGLCIRPFFLISFFLLSVVSLSSFVPASFYIDTPEAVFYRLIPGLIWRPYPTFLVSLAYFFFIFFLYQYLSGSHRRTVVVFGLLAASFVERDITLEGETFVGTSLVKEGYVLRDSSNQERLNALKTSPSNYLLQAYGNDLALLKLNEQTGDELTRLPSLDLLSCYGAASKNSEDIALAFDGSYTTRWSTKGPQNEGDWFEVRCKEPISARQVILSVVHNPSDFPRGIKVDIFDKEKSRKIMEFKEWFGPVHFTKAGLPYFGPQGRVQLDFPEKITTDRLRFTLTKGDPGFDWTIAEIIVME